MKQTPDAQPLTNAELCELINVIHRAVASIDGKQKRHLALVLFIRATTARLVCVSARFNRLSKWGLSN